MNSHVVPNAYIVPKSQSLLHELVRYTKDSSCLISMRNALQSRAACLLMASGLTDPLPLKKELQSIFSHTNNPVTIFNRRIRAHPVNSQKKIPNQPSRSGSGNLAVFGGENFGRDS